MNLTPVLRRAVLALVLLGCAAVPLAAQSVLYTDVDGKFLAVRRARGTQPFVQVDGKLVAAYGHHYSLQKGSEYLPVFVAVRDVDVTARNLSMSGSEINHEFVFQATLETPYSLDDVFIALELNTGSAGKLIFLDEVGNLAAREPKSISVAVPMTTGLGEGKYVLHIFAGGQEVLHSRIPPQVRDAVVDGMTRKQIAGVQDAAPALFIGPGPEYPGALLKAKLKGEAMISVRIGPTGQVYDPKVKSASDPAFGASALEAVRLWRFLPRVKNGRPVETLVDVPINFTPPEKKT